MIIERGRDEGLPALDAGEFDRAYQLLSAAKAAVDALGGVGEDADKIRDAAKEAAIFVNLCPDTLEDMLAEAGRIDPDAWASKFETLYKGRSYIFDTFIESTPQDGDTGAYEIAYVVFPPGEASRFGDGGLARPDRFARDRPRRLRAASSMTGPNPGTRQSPSARSSQSIVYDAEQRSLGGPSRAQERRLHHALRGAARPSAGRPSRRSSCRGRNSHERSPLGRRDGPLDRPRRARSFGRQPAATAVTVEPASLERRTDLVGREVLVDDRVAYYVPRTGLGG